MKPLNKKTVSINCLKRKPDTTMVIPDVNKDKVRKLLFK